MSTLAAPPAAGRSWAPGPPRPQLAPRAAHVWRADLTRAPGELAELLSPAERARAERFHRERDSELWARSRGMLRALLGRYLQSDPRLVPLTADRHGKPAVAFGRLSFNLSHSGGIALFAFAETGRVGVDVEVSRRPIDAAALAGRAFGPAAAERLRRVDPASREQEFLRAWVRHEAALKWRGTGIGGNAEEGDGRTPWIAELENAGRAAAIALDAAPSELRCWDWV